MPVKSNTAALVLIPPEGVWDPIQAIRKVHDRNIRRWMPHITLLYPFRPFRPSGGIESDEGLIEAACAKIAPFEVTLGGAAYFPESRTVWIDPEPSEPILDLQSVLMASFPDCDDSARYARGFVPHLSVGQSRDGALRAMVDADWRPITFTADRISYVCRKDLPDDPFKVGREFPFGGNQKS